MGTFDEFVTVRSHRLLQTAYLLTRDHALAEDLLQTALAKSWPGWDRIDGDPEAYVRRTMVNTYNSWWRRKWNGEVPSPSLPDTAVAAPQGRVDDRDEVWRAVARLPKRQRAVVVLRYFEDLTETQIAETLSISAGAVRSYATKALAKLRADPALLAQAPKPLTAPDSSQLIVEVKQLAKQNSRTRAAIAAASAVVVAVVVGLLMQLKPVSPPPPAVPSPTFPSYYEGYRTVLHQQRQFADFGNGAFSFVPATETVIVWMACVYADQGEPPMVSLLVDGEALLTQPCEGTGQLTLGAGRMLSGLAPGAALTLNFSLANDSAPDDGSAMVAIGEPVPGGGYPTPSAPQPLPELSPPAWGSHVFQPGETGPATMVWGPRYMRLDIVCQTPGELLIKVDGKLVKTVSCRDPDGTMATYPVAADPAIADRGSTVSVTVEAFRFTGDWRVVFGPEY